MPRWPKNGSANPAALYRLFHGEGTTDLYVDQTTAGPGSTWIAFGLFPLAPNEDHRVELEGSISYVTGADAIAVSVAPIAATWTPDLPVCPLPMNCPFDGKAFNSKPFNNEWLVRERFP